MKAKVTWKGAGEGAPEGQEEVNRSRGIDFKKGEAVETTDGALIEMAKNHPHYEVQMLEEDAAPKRETVIPPSQEGAQRAVPKPGEPVPQELKPGESSAPKPAQPSANAQARTSTTQPSRPTQAGQGMAQRSHPQTVPQGAQASTPPPQQKPASTEGDKPKGE